MQFRSAAPSKTGKRTLLDIKIDPDKIVDDEPPAKLFKEDKENDSKKKLRKASNVNALVIAEKKSVVLNEDGVKNAGEVISEHVRVYLISNMFLDFKISFLQFHRRREFARSSASRSAQ